MTPATFKLTRSRKAPTVKPAAEADLLASIHTVNRAAKRYRDKATKHYSAAQYGLATNARHVKERLYGLKDRGIVHAFRSGLLTATGLHGCLTYFEGGDGYRFHSLLRPAGREIPVLSEDLIQVEAKPKGKREVRLMDAEYTLGLLPAVLVNDGFVRHHFPQRHRPRPAYDWHDEDDYEEDED